MFSAKRDGSLVEVSSMGINDRIKENKEHIKYLTAISDTLPNPVKLKRIIEVTTFTNRLLYAMLQNHEIKLTK